MSTQAIDIAGATAVHRLGGALDPAASGRTPESFVDALDEARGAAAQTDRLRHAAEQLVSTALYLPLLKQARQSAFRSDLFHGGFGEDAFGAQFDQQIADRLAERTSHGLADAVAARFTRTPTDTH
jgi:Rod binding domain-containing protein